MDSAELIELIRQHKPWHQNIQLTPDVDVRSAFSPEELERKNNENVAFISHREPFARKVGNIYPDGVEGKTFLDCACNAGSYCFWMQELGAKQAHGFDVREHWINQANLVRNHRTVHSTDRTSFEVCDLMQIPERNIEPVDFVLFKGIFYHLADPIRGLKIAADLAKETIWVNTAMIFSEDNQSLHCVFEQIERKMSGKHALSWLPTGPKVIAMMLHWLGFEDIWHMFSKPNQNDPSQGRMEVIASREPGKLDELKVYEGATKMPNDGYAFSSSVDPSVLSMH